MKMSKTRVRAESVRARSTRNAVFPGSNEYPPNLHAVTSYPRRCNASDQNWRGGVFPLIKQMYHEPTPFAPDPTYDFLSHGPTPPQKPGGRLHTARAPPDHDVIWGRPTRGFEPAGYR